MQIKCLWQSVNFFLIPSITGMTNILNMNSTDIGHRIYQLFLSFVLNKLEWSLFRVSICEMLCLRLKYFDDDFIMGCVIKS